MRDNRCITDSTGLVLLMHGSKSSFLTPMNYYDVALHGDIEISLKCGFELASLPGLRAAFGCMKELTASNEKLGGAWE